MNRLDLRSTNGPLPLRVLQYARIPCGRCALDFSVVNSPIADGFMFSCGSCRFSMMVGRLDVTVNTLCGIERLLRDMLAEFLEKARTRPLSYYARAIVPAIFADGWSCSPHTSPINHPSNCQVAHRCRVEAMGCRRRHAIAWTKSGEVEGWCP